MLIISIYHTLIYFLGKLKLVGSYSIYLWLGLSYLILAVATVPYKTFKVPNINYLISSGVFWLSLLAYLNFLLVVLNISADKETRTFKLVKRTYLITPIYFLLRFPYFFFPTQYVEFVKACGFIMDGYLFFVFGYLIYLLYSDKKADVKNYVLIGSILIVFFNFFTSISYYTQGYIFGLSHVSFIALGYFSDIIFFSLAVGWQIRENIEAKYLALAELSKKETLLEIEKQRASDILLTQNFKVEAERTKAIIEQRTAIGRKLHDGLSASLIVLRFLVQDFKAKAANSSEKEKFEDIETEINHVYKEARNYSHELSKKTTIADSEVSYDIGTFLATIAQQFSNIDLLTMHVTFNQDQLREKLNGMQTKHIYFLLKECISNTIKHSAAKNIWISISFSNGKCYLNYADDGAGFKAELNEGLGLKGMQDSVKELGGELNFGAGTANTNISIEFTVA